MDEEHYEQVIDRLVELAGSKAEIARRMGVRPQDIQNWGARGIPLSKCNQIEREFSVPMHELRPDAFSAPVTAQSV